MNGPREVNGGLYLSPLFYKYNNTEQEQLLMAEHKRNLLLRRKFQAEVKKFPFL